ncbi:MAG: IMP dehydrogenase, partial [Thermoproteota archaeon]|nr:IMP dehydrogenase [Thermoproteota archaeon]
MDIVQGLTFDDVLLVPKRSPIVSRSQTNLRTKLSRNITLNIPIISAN